MSPGDDKGVDPIVTYETDEDEFQGKDDSSPVVVTCFPALKHKKEPRKIKNTAKREMSAQRRRILDYDLAYFNLWWSRMAVEGMREAK